MKTTILTLMLTATFAHAKPPKWVQVGSNENVVISIADNKTVLLKRKTLYKVLVQFKYPDLTSTQFRYADCDNWTLGLNMRYGEVAGENTMAHSILDHVCPK